MKPHEHGLVAAACGGKGRFILCCAVNQFKFEDGQASRDIVESFKLVSKVFFDVHIGPLGNTVERRLVAGCGRSRQAPVDPNATLKFSEIVQRSK
ncbi:hypothetical protein ACFQAT_24560 [Undibacterium arcticum]|uniref:Uncharacterized protein n=1 Tax=Undibacterium arcticum TaxID=1762892 RepID=A0ABV7F965_9BURK